MRRTPVCTGCWYDMTGLAESWADACPIESTCPECGKTQPTRDLYLFSPAEIPGPVEQAFTSRAFGMLLALLVLLDVGVVVVVLVAHAIW